MPNNLIKFSFRKSSYCHNYMGGFWGSGIEFEEIRTFAYVVVVSMYIFLLC